MTTDNTDYALLSLLQLASPGLPVGAYSYSEGLETLVETGTIKNKQSLKHWLEQDLRYGAVRLEAAVMLRAYQSSRSSDLMALGYWNSWLSAARETEELRSSSWQMGRSLIRLLLELQPLETQTNQYIQLRANAAGDPCNFAIAFGIAAAYWQIELSSALLGYLHSWVTNSITAGIKSIPLGQTAGQQLLVELQANLKETTGEILKLKDDDLNSCGWGLSLCSMAHETQYTRLFRS